jgi:hypothetical protein
MQVSRKIKKKHQTKYIVQMSSFWFLHTTRVGSHLLQTQLYSYKLINHIEKVQEYTQYNLLKSPSCVMIRFVYFYT